MQSTLTHQNHFSQPTNQGASARDLAAGTGGAIRRWLRATTRSWRQRKMSAALNALDDRMLRDIGLIRADIPRVVRHFDERELRMVPLAPSTPVEKLSYYPTAA